MEDLVEGYTSAMAKRSPDSFDEAYGLDEDPLPHYRDTLSVLAKLGVDELTDRVDTLSRAFRDQGVTFDLDGEERPFPIDVVPRVLTSGEWSLIERGVKQRVNVLEAFLADVYGPGHILDDGVIPRGIVMSSPQFLRPAYGLRPPNGVRIHVAGIDVIRDETGTFRVLEDNLRSPSGVSYVLANRHAMARVLPELFTGQYIRAVTDYPSHLISALRAAAPTGVADPTVVVLTPGVFNPAFYEHALLARLMGVELIEGRDLVTRGAEVFLRSTDGEVPVHVIYRRIDDDYLDPLQFRPDSLVGCPGLLNAARAGGVTIANAVGNGIADDKLVYTYVPDMIRYYAGEEPILDNVESFRLIDPDVREESIQRAGELVFKRVDGSGGKDVVIGPQAEASELARLAEMVRRDPRAWVAQQFVDLSTAPTWTGGRLVRRHVDLRPFAVNNGQGVWVLPGGLTRVALQEGEFVVNSSRGGGSKDTWVVTEREARQPQPDPPVSTTMSGLRMDPGPNLDTETQQQQQQQQQGPPC